MTLQKVKYTNLRGTTYWLHIKLPTDIYNKFDLTSQLVRHSLNTNDPAKASMLAQLLAFKIKEFYSSPETKITSNAIKRFIEMTLSSLGESEGKGRLCEQQTEQTPLISIAFEQYKSEAIRADRWRPQTQYDNIISNRVFIELLGDMPINQLSPAHFRKYRDLLMKYPVQKQKIKALKELTIQQVISSTVDYPNISLTTINNHLRRTSSFLNWLNDQGHQVPNTLNRMKIRQNKSLKSLRSPFDTKDLIQLFSSSIFTSLEFNHDYQYWLPLLGLYTGCRLEELCQLHIDDIKIEADIPYLSIDDKHVNQHIKSDSSRRDIPIHHELIQLGFSQFVNEKLKMGETMLFGYLKPQRSKYGHQPSKWFGKFKHAQKVSDSKKVFHSFRHTMVESLKQSRAYDYEIKAILGHCSGSITHDIYGSASTAIELINDAIQKVSFREAIQQVRIWC